jgi:glycosyltransferase involved in cell wall biosynthesis
MGVSKVSVVIPAYNSADYTIETVDSVLQQTHSDVEVIVVDDGSTDGTREALKRYGDAIQYVYKENGGACSARNLGIGMATGDYIACLDCDDLWVSEKLEYSVQVLDNQRELGLVYTACYLLDADGEIVELVKSRANLANAYRELLNKNFIIAPTVVMRRSCLESVGLFDESIFIPADWDLWLRFAQRFPIGYIDRPLSKYRQASNYSLQNLDQFFEESMYVLDKNLKNNADFSAREKNKIYNHFLLTYSNVHRQIGNLSEARQILMTTIKRDRCEWQAYLLYLISFLGQNATSITRRIVNRLC